MTLVSLPSVSTKIRRLPAAVICLVSVLVSASVAPPPSRGEIADVLRLPQEIAPYVDAAGERLKIDDGCRAALLEEFRASYFAPWTRTEPRYDPGETRESIRKTARGEWYGEDRQARPREMMGEILANCALESFPSRNQAAVAVAPSHLRGLPTLLPLYTAREGYPFDMLQYPHVKLNEPLRLLHASRDGLWLFVETACSSGWLESRDVALVDREFADSWMARTQLVVVQDHAAVDAGGEGEGHRVKLGTLLPLVSAGEGWWEVAVAVAGENRQAVVGTARIPTAMAALHPLAFNRENVTLLGNQLLGQPYGWGEMHGLRDCSAMLRDFFLPFGIWLPRTAADQIASAGRCRDLVCLTPQDKEGAIRREGLPFLTLIYKPGHVMLYVGTDREGKPLVFHSIWSIRVKDAAGERPRCIGRAVITTLEPGKELGVAGGTLLEQGTALATITGRCGGGR